MRVSKKGIAAFILAVALPVSAFAADTELQKKIDDLSQQLDLLKQQVRKTEEKVEKTDALAKQTDEKSLGKWLTIGGDYRFRIDSLTGNVPSFYSFNPAYIGWVMGGMTGAPPAMTQGFRASNDTLMTNRIGLNLKAKATENVSVKVRLLAYKVSGSQNDSSVIGPYFADRAGSFDGTLGHVPSNGQLTVDQAYATWSNIAEQPVWFSVGRRPSAGGSPSHLKNNMEKAGTAGTPALLVDYAFDGLSLGYAPDIDVLGSPFMKLCYGRGFDSGYSGGPTQNNSLRDTDMLGVQVVPYNTDDVMVTLQWNRAFNIFNSPEMMSGTGPISAPTTNLGSIDWLGADIIGKVGSLNWFFDAAVSLARPNNNTAFMGANVPPPIQGMPIGLMYSGQRTGKNGWALYLGGRYDLESTGTKFGLEYNHGSNDWITFAPAADDIWTSKLGTRGDVIEPYIIQELKLKAISSVLSKVFFKVGTVDPIVKTKECRV